MSDPISLSYPSLVQQSDKLTSVSCGRVVHNNTCHVTQGQKVYTSSFVHDDSDGMSTEITRDEVVMDSSGTSSSMYLGVLQEFSSVQTMQPIVTTNPETTMITSLDSSSVYNLTLDGSISWDKDSSCLYLSANKAFRFRYIESDGVLPSRLVLEGLNETTDSYDPKVEFSSD